jgi:hypothetical protein
MFKIRPTALHPFITRATFPCKNKKRKPTSKSRYYLRKQPCWMCLSAVNQSAGNGGLFKFLLGVATITVVCLFVL